MALQQQQCRQHQCGVWSYTWFSPESMLSNHQTPSSPVCVCASGMLVCVCHKCISAASVFITAV